MLTTLVKQPAETLRVPLAFPAAIATIVSVGVQARGLVPGAPALTATASIAGSSVELLLAGGGDGERYLATVRAQLADGETIEQEVDVAVLDVGWALPTGGALYLSIGDFVLRAGYDELVRATDPDSSGRIDAQMVGRALVDAQSIVEGYLAGRYQLPLAIVPPLVALAIADLALARLYPRGAPDGIATRETAALKLLASIQSGTMPLPIAGAIAAEAPSEAPVVIAPGRRLYPDNLAGY